MILAHSVVFLMDFGRQLKRRAPLKGRELNLSVEKREFLRGLVAILRPRRDDVSDWTLTRISFGVSMFGVNPSMIDQRYII